MVLNMVAICSTWSGWFSIWLRFVQLGRDRFRHGLVGFQLGRGFFNMAFNMVAFFSTWSSWFSTWFDWYSTWLCLFQLQSRRKLLNGPPASFFPGRLAPGAGANTVGFIQALAIPHGPRPTTNAFHTALLYWKNMYFLILHPPRQHISGILHLVVVPIWTLHTACKTIMRKVAR